MQTVAGTSLPPHTPPTSLPSHAALGVRLTWLRPHTHHSLAYDFRCLSYSGDGGKGNNACSLDLEGLPRILYAKHLVRKA